MVDHADHSGHGHGTSGSSSSSLPLGKDEIRTLLVEQVTQMVRWRESVLQMKELGVDTLIESARVKC